MTLLRCDVAVVGGGPAGALAARALALSGRDVVLCEASVFPRDHVGVCLNDGAARLLAKAGLPHLLHTDTHRAVALSRRSWESPEPVEAPRSDIICDRGVLDRDLLAAAAEAGVRVLQPVRVHDRIDGDRWTLHVSGSDIAVVEAAFLVEASGRRQAARRQRLAPPTLALSSRWRGTGDAIGLCALHRSWVWTAPAADGQTVVLVTLGSNDPDLADATIEDVHSRLARASGLVMPWHEPASAVAAIDATPFDCFAADRKSLRIGEAALGLDPLSSSGLSTAIQSALAGAVVVDTLLDSCGDHEAALDYAQSAHNRRRQVHAARTAEAYAAAAPRFGSSFWTERASWPDRKPSPEPIPPLPRTTTRLERAATLRLLNAPCIRGNRVERFPAIEMADSGDPIAFVEGVAIAPLIRSVQGSQSAEHLVRDWGTQVGQSSALRILSWAWQNRLLVATAAQ